MKSKLLLTKNKRAPKGKHGKYEPRQWIEVARVGEWPNRAPAEATLADGSAKTYEQGVVQIITLDSLNEIVDAFDYATDSPTLIDKEHESTVPGGSTQALGWVVDLKIGNASVDPSGQPGDGKATDVCLWAQPRYSASGLNAVQGGEFLQLSPHFACRFLPGEETKDIPKVEPVFLTDVALTNKPNMMMTSIANARPDPVPAPPVQNPVGPNGPTQKETKPKTTMKKLAALLGLPETATEDELAAALQAVLDSQKATATEVANMKAAAADAFITKHAASIPNTDAARAAWKTLHIANAAQAEAMIGGGANQPTTAPVQNAAPAVVPVFQPAAATVPATPGAAVETQNAVPDPSKMDDAMLLKTYNSQPKGEPKALFYRAHKARLSKLIA